MNPLPAVIVAEPALARARSTTRTVVAHLRSLGSEVRAVEIPLSGLPRGVSDEHRALWGNFAATPDLLVESWRVARHLEALTAPGDTVVVSELASAAGIFTLEQAMASPADRRRVVIAAGDGELLQHLAVAGVAQGVTPEAEAAIDWELVAYRFADAVLATSGRAVTLLAGAGVDAGLAVAPAGSPLPSPPRRASRRVWLPEPVARLSQTGAILRALADSPDVEVFVTTADRPDHLWTGTAWEALAGTASLLGDRLARTEEPPPCDTVILGDPFAVPDEGVAELRAAGFTVLVAEGSVAAGLWPEATTWSTSDDLAALVAGGPGRRPPAPPALPLPVRERPAGPDRARRVSVGVPIFGDVRFLDECLASLIGQTQPPHEIVLMDDGSQSEEVTAAMERWAERDPRVRLMRQPNRGVCVARNTMLETMTGDSFLLLDADDVLRPGFLEACAGALRANPDLTGVATWTEFFGDYQGVEAKPPFDARVGMRENPIVSTAALLDMEVRDYGIRFSPDLAFIYCEDWEVWSRIVAAGGRFGLVPRPLARHRVHPGSGGHRRTALALALGKARATLPLRGGGSSPPG